MRTKEGIRVLSKEWLLLSADMEYACLRIVPGLTNPISESDIQTLLLASNCFQCHGTGGVGGFDRIRGSDAAEVRDYLRKSARSDIMAAHAQGYTSAQLDAIIAYLKQ